MIDARTAAGQMNTTRRDPTPYVTKYLSTVDETVIKAISAGQRYAEFSITIYDSSARYDEAGSSTWIGDKTPTEVFAQRLRELGYEVLVSRHQRDFFSRGKGPTQHTRVVTVTINW